MDRLLARLGLLNDAPPLFGSRPAVPRAGVLLALPALVATGIFDCAHQIYRSLGPAFFGLRPTLLTLLLMALWRIGRPEGLKEHSPAELGRVLQLEARRAKMLRRVPVQALSPEPVVKLAPEIKHLTNLVKMVAYQAESELVRAVAPHYRRVEDEGRTLIQAALLSAADLEVTARELHVTLLPQSSPHRTRAIAALCDELNSLNTVFPGSRLGLRYAIHTPS